jgi:hypothetical protein
VRESGILRCGNRSNQRFYLSIYQRRASAAMTKAFPYLLCKVHNFHKNQNGQLLSLTNQTKKIFIWCGYFNTDDDVVNNPLDLLEKNVKFLLHKNILTLSYVAIIPLIGLGLGKC